MTLFHIVDGVKVQCTDAQEKEYNGMWERSEAALKDPEGEGGQNIRKLRNSLLSETDYMAVADRTMSEEWKTYRQELRDLPSKEGFPWDGKGITVTWPTKPS